MSKSAPLNPAFLTEPWMQPIDDAHARLDAARRALMLFELAPGAATSGEPRDPKTPRGKAEREVSAARDALRAAVERALAGDSGASAVSHAAALVEAHNALSDAVAERQAALAAGRSDQDLDKLDATIASARRALERIEAAPPAVDEQLRDARKAALRERFLADYIPAQKAYRDALAEACRMLDKLKALTSISEIMLGDEALSFVTWPHEIIDEGKRRSYDERAEIGVAAAMRVMRRAA